MLIGLFYVPSILLELPPKLLPLPSRPDGGQGRKKIATRHQGKCDDGHLPDCQDIFGLQSKVVQRGDANLVPGGYGGRAQCHTPWRYDAL